MRQIKIVLSMEQVAMRESSGDQDKSMTSMLWPRSSRMRVQFSTFGVSHFSPKAADELDPGRNSQMRVVESLEQDARKRPRFPHRTALTAPSWRAMAASARGPWPEEAEIRSTLLLTPWTTCVPRPWVDEMPSSSAMTRRMDQTRTLLSAPPVANLEPSGCTSTE